MLTEKFEKFEKFYSSLKHRIFIEKFSNFCLKSFFNKVKKKTTINLLQNDYLFVKRKILTQ